MPSHIVARGLAILSLASAISWLGCGGSGSDLTDPEPGSLDVTTVTTGPELDPDGYTVSIDGAAPEAIAVNGSRQIEGLAPGQHTVALAGLAGNCTTAGDASITAEVVSGAAAAVRYELVCAATTGTIEVVTTSAGSPPDPDGYQLQLDGAAAQPIGTGATASIPGVAPGSHSIGLGELASNCSVDGDNPRAVTVEAGALVHVALLVTCRTIAPPPAPGSISVTTQTGGPDPDADGYAVSLDGTGAVAIGVSASVALPDLAPGPHTVGLAGLSGNCRLDGDNPRVVTVSPGSVAPVAFAITCTALPPSSGTIAISAATTGPDQDPNGYAFTIDQRDAQPIGANGTASVAGLPVGSHSVQLREVAANCTIAGDNPRAVTVTAGGTAKAAFGVTCTPATGALKVTTTTTGTPADPDGYTVTIDAAAPVALGTSASVTAEALAPGPHSVRLAGLAANCRVQGENPRTVAVAAGTTVTTAFAVTCTATTGTLTVAIAGLPAGTDAAVTVTGPGGFSRAFTATATLADLVPGSYTVAAADVSSGGVQFTPSPRSRAVTVAAAATTNASVTYGPVAGPSVNFRIDGWFLTQSVQSADGDVPLVQNRDGFIRVFVVADGPNTAAPSVRLRLFRNGVLARTFDIPAPGPSVPQSRNEDDLGTSWNVKLPRDLFGPGLTVLADVDPTNAIAEKSETDNSYPVSGTPETATMRSVPALGVLFVPVRQQTSGLTGDVSVANKVTFLSLPRRMLPISTAQDEVHQVYTTTTPNPLVANDANGAWGTIVGEINALRVTEGTGQHYYGVVRIDYAYGVAGVGYIGWPTAIGYDREDDRSRVMTHEMGHNFGRQHSPCGAPGGIDPNYPLSNGLTGAYGYDLQEDVLRSPFLPDIMGYCGLGWISPYTYEGVLAFRTAGQSALAASAGASPQRCLLVWGRIVDGQAVLEPAFEIVTRPSLPKARGRYLLEAASDDGSRLFSLSFDPAEIEDGRRDTRQFAFAVPLGGIAGDEIGSLRLSGPGAAAAAARAATGLQGARAASPVVEARPVAGGVALRWDAAAHPMVMVRDPDTGEVVSFARGGTANVATNKRMLDLVVSDRVGSRQVRVTAGQ